MLRMVQSNSAEGAKRYFTEGLTREDYYAGDATERGMWGGKGARSLGLQGEVDRDAFVRLCDNQRPDGSGRLTERTKANRRVGYDINFHCPKSVSVLHSLTDDPAILAAFERSVGNTMAMMEGEAKARVRVDGQAADRWTGNLVWATFVHTTSRPIDGLPDPHLHAHCFTFNATWDGEEKRWKAGQFGDLKRDAPFFESCFHSELARNLALAGYAIERRGKGWEIAGVPESVLTKFSRRTSQIEALAKAKGIHDPEEKANLGARTRRSKDESLPMRDVGAAWERTLTDSERESIRRSKAAPSTNPGLAAGEAVRLSLASALERKSVVSERSVLEGALRASVGTASLPEISRALQTAELIRREVDGRVLVTTRAVLQEEKRMIDFARDGRGTCRPFTNGPSVAAEPKLNAGQRRAVEYLLTSADRVMVVRGKAGTGKTTLMQTAVAQIEASGRRVHVFAPTTEASRGVLRHEGFENAETVARLLLDSKLQERVRGGVLWVDEAGLLGSKSAAALFEVAKAQNARVVLSGDSKQHRSVERGDALRVLERDAGLGAATLRDVVRQRGEYKSAVEQLGEGRVVEGFHKLDRIGAIKEADAVGAHLAIAKEYIDTVRAGKTALVVSPTHAEGRAVTAEIRLRMRDEKLLGESRPLERLQPLGFTVAERSDPAHYQAGHVVEFHQNVKGFRAGTRCEVLGRTAAGEVRVRYLDGSTTLPLTHSDRFDVFERQPFEVAAGDVLRVTRNGRVPAGDNQTISGTRQLPNGSLHRVRGFTRSSDVRLENGWVVPKDFGHLAHGYCLTSHASQGKTVDRVFISQSSASFGASSAEQFYVSASRARERAVIYTDDKAALLEAVQKSSDRMSAVDLVKAPPPPLPPSRIPDTLPLRRHLEPHRDRELDRGR